MILNVSKLQAAAFQRFTSLTPGAATCKPAEGFAGEAPPGFPCWNSSK